MLSVANLINVTVNLSPNAAIGRNFGVLMIAGDSGVINGLQRFRIYTNINDVASDFGISAPEYLAAALYFGQSPKPATCYIGAWLRTATHGMNLGAILSPSQQNIANFNAISNGAFDISIDGTPQTLTGINFNGTTNLNGVATAVNSVLTGALCTWNGSEFVITSNSSGAGVDASGSITFTGPGSNLDTITVDGTLITLVTGTPVGSQVQIGATAAATAGNLYTFLAASADVNISKASYSLLGAVITVTYKTVGTVGNSFTLAKSSTAITLSGANLTGGAVPSSVSFATSPGSGTDISALLGLTAILSLDLVPGYNAETPAQCAAVLAGLSTGWYGLMFAASVMPTPSQSLAVSAFIEAQTITRLYGVTTQDTASLSSLSSSDLGAEMKAAGYDQSMIQYSSTNFYAVASLFGRAFSVDFTAQNSTINLMYKQEPGVLPEDLSDSEGAVLKSKNINVYAEYDNGTSIIQFGICSGGQYIDTIQGVDWFQNQVQTDCFNTLFLTAKVPQTDPGINQLTNACTSACQDAINNGLAAPGVWNGPSFGSLQTGQFLKLGYYVFAPSVATQSQADRDARLAPPIQIALKLAGAVDQADVLVNVNQ